MTNEKLEVSTAITLKSKDGDSVKNIPFEVEEIDGEQFQNALLIIKNIIAMQDEEPKVKEIIETISHAFVSDETDEAVEAKMLSMALYAFDVLLVTVPDVVFDLLSTLSGIDKELVKKQKLMKQYDIFDAILEANDFEQIVKRGKRSLAVAKAKMAWVKLTKRATLA